MRARHRFAPVLAALSLPVLLSACNDLVPDKAAQANALAHAEAIARAEGKIECAPAGRADLRVECAIDRVQTQDGLFLTLRHPEGSFHRLLVTTDGRGVVAADGAEPAVVTPLGPDRIEVGLGGARYRLPATVRQPGADKSE